MSDKEVGFPLTKLLGNILNCSLFIDSGKRYETLGSETKDFITPGITSSMSFMFVLVPLVLPSPWRQYGWAQMNAT